MNGGGFGARTSYGIKVTLNVYDLSPANEYLFPIGLGMYHSGVQIGGSEYTFAGGGGVFDHTPMEPGAGAIFRESIELGSFEGGQHFLKQTIGELKPMFEPDSYHVITKNCNHFADALCERLLQKNIPGHVNRLANIGSCFAGCLPKSLLESNGQTDAGSPTPSYQVMGGGNRRLGGTSSQSNTSSTQVFSGKGTSLGSSSSVSNNDSSESSEQLSDRRERMRKARLAKLGGN